MKLILFACKSFIRRGHRNLLAIVVLAFGLLVFFVGNAILEGGAAGLSSIYRNSLVGDAAIGFNDPQPVSIWGYEELFSSQFTKIPNLPNATEFMQELKDNPAIASITPLVASAALLESGQTRSPIYILGTAAATFFPNRKLNFVSGGPPPDDSKAWIVVSQGISATLGHMPQVGEQIQITFADANGFIIRALPIAGVIDFPVRNSALDSLCLVDLPSAWELFGLAEKTELVTKEKPSSDNNFDDLFTEGDVTAQTGNTEDWNANDIASLMQANPGIKKRPVAGDLNFLLLSYKPGFNDSRFLPSVKSELATHQARLLDWHSAAGQSLRYIASIQLIFNIGMVLFSILIIVIFINTVGNAIMERRSEIGILRALGARRKKVALIFSVEYILVGLISFSAAWVIGSLTILGLNSLQIQLTNEVLINLFGGTILRAQMSSDIGLLGIIISLLVPLLVIVLMSGRLAGISPRQAMQNGT